MSGKNGNGGWDEETPVESPKVKRDEILREINRKLLEQQGKEMAALRSDFDEFRMLLLDKLADLSAGIEDLTLKVEEIAEERHPAKKNLKA